MGKLLRLARILSLIAALAASATSASVAGAQSSGAPAPGCAGLAGEDEAGDASRLEGQAEAPDNFDITGVFFTHRDGKTYANMRTVAGGAELPVGASGARWYIYWTTSVGEKFVRAAINNFGAPIFQYGSTVKDPNTQQTQFSPEGETGGRFVEGAPGYLEMEIPADYGGAPGTELSSPRAETFDVVGNQLFGIDTAPEGGVGDSYVVGACENGPAPSDQPMPVDAPATDVPAPAPAPAPASDPSPVRAAESAVAAPAALLVKLAKPGVKAPRGRSLSLAVTGTGQFTQLRARLLSGRKTVGTGALAKLAGKGTLKLKLSKRLKPGAYVLALTGITADGRVATPNLKLRLR
jgi:hypothetical protein